MKHNSIFTKQLFYLFCSQIRNLEKERWWTDFSSNVFDSLLKESEIIYSDVIQTYRMFQEVEYILIFITCTYLCKLFCPKRLILIIYSLSASNVFHSAKALTYVCISTYITNYFYVVMKNKALKESWKFTFKISY